MVTNWLQPSNMSSVLGATHAPPLLQRNFDLISVRFGLAMPHTISGGGVVLTPAQAAAAIQANFDAVASSLSLTLFSVADAADPGVCAQANFQLINAQW